MNGFVTTTHLRAAYINDPVPALPENFFDYEQCGTKVHFYTCNDYLALEPFYDDYPISDLLATDDHT